MPDVKIRGFTDLPCIKCGEIDCVQINLDTLTTFRCASCEEEFNIDDVREIVQTWGEVVHWLESTRAEPPKETA